MTDEIKLIEQASRGVRAQRLMEDELLVEAFAKLEAAYIERWRSTGAREQEDRQLLWQAVQVLGKVKDHLQRIAANGKVAAKELDLAEKRSRFSIAR